MRDTIIRTLRTFLQGFIGTLALLAVPVLNTIIQTVAGGGTVEIDLNVWQSVGFAAVAGGVIALIAFGQNALEEKTGTHLGPK